MKIKSFWIGVIAFSVLFALTGNKPIFAKELEGTLKKIQDLKTISLGYRESSIPFAYLDDEQKPIGYSMDLCYRIVEDVKKRLAIPELKVTLNPVTSQTRIPLISNGTIDLECGSTTNSVERQKQVAFSVTTFVTGIRLLVKSDSQVTSLQDLDKKPVVTTTGTTSDRLIKEYEQQHHIKVKDLYGKDHAQSFLMVETGRAAAFVMDDVLLAGLIANAKQPESFKMIGEPLRIEPYGLLLRKDDPSFKEIVDNTLKQMMENGEMEKIYTKWFTNPIPPRDINLRLPMSEKLKELMQHPNDQGI